MKLYHFTADHMLESIRREDLTLGKLPVIKDGKLHGFVDDCQWLTRNPDFDQSWQQNGRLPYRRNAFRLTIKIPRSSKESLVPWMTLNVPGHEILDEFGDPKNWMVFHGRIPPGWIREIFKNPVAA